MLFTRLARTKCINGDGGFGDRHTCIYEGDCHDSVNSKGLFIVRTRLPPRVYSLSPKSSKYKDVHRPSGVTV